MENGNNGSKITVSSRNNFISDTKYSNRYFQDKVQ